ncbi:SRPBCC domain-containing protein [Ramlibacter sp. WS9]|uniref:SRPBCC family protein n=1 Tax=Ramlibacter sp. WS9 TaxID=1882741 RepID=UPI001141A9AD|nr:SRPBCC domain-containing protein [Ramlibacter sp. WS9]ROZ78330.1 SRPBCC domain-containing protein [Ramlibacter sp. WS9]
MAQSPTQDRPSLSITRHYAVPPEKVWRAWTEPQALSRWFGPADTESVTSAELDVRVGGRYSIAFRTADGEEHRVSGVYQEVAPLRRLRFTWAWQSTPDRVSLVAIELEPKDGGCELRFRHDRFFDQQARDNHERGWTGTFIKLDAFLQR